MRVLGSTLTNAQKAMGNAIAKIVLTQQGDSTTYTYDIDSTTNRILDLKHSEQEWSQVAQVLIDNRDSNLTDLALEGYSGVISWGYHTTSDEYSATAPVTVIAQKADSLQAESVTSLTLAGLFNMWSEQKATEAYAPDKINTDTVKTILDAIAGATMTCFSSYPAHTITYDTGYDDDIINAFTPTDNFSVAVGESRLSAFRKAMSYIKDKCRVENDSGVATIHVFLPTTTGTTYDYEYNDALAATNHNFFNKSVRKRLVLPNLVTVKNHPDHTDTFTGSAVDTPSYTALGNQYYTKTVYLRCTSNAQCVLVATAILQRYQLDAERGHGIAPMNVGQEVFDYVKITDSWVDDTRIGNVGYLNRWYSHYAQEPTRFGFEFRFGSLLLTGLAGTLAPQVATLKWQDYSPADLFGWLVELQDMVGALAAIFEAFKEKAEFKNLSVTERLQIPHGTNKYG